MPRKFQGRWESNSNSLTQRPALAAHVGIIASLSAHIDYEMANLLAMMLHADAALATAMYVAITNDGSRQAAMKAAAENCLSPDDLKEFDELLRRVKSAVQRRNDVIHAVWGIPANTPDTIVLLDPRVMAKHWAALRGWQGRDHFTREGMKKDWDRMGATFQKLMDSPMEYDEADFIAIEDALRTALARINKLAWKLQQQSSPPIPGPQNQGSPPRSP